MSGLLDIWRERQHAVVTVVAAWLILTSPWIGMLRRLPSDPGWANLAHVWLGLAALPLAAAYLFDCVRGGGWHQNFPWLSPRQGALWSDLKGLFRGRLPAAEGGGLFGAIAGLTLLALLVAAVTGAAWYWTQGSSEALDWRERHIVAARCLIGLLVAHIVAASLHILDFIRD